MIKQERLRIDLWASVKPIIEAETQRSGLTAQEVVNIALVDYFGLSPRGKAKAITQQQSQSIQQTENEDYI